MSGATPPQVYDKQAEKESNIVLHISFKTCQILKGCKLTFYALQS
jgi:hypothetical protein